MADNTAIEWTDATWNPITGCSVISPGCTNCYAMKLAGTRLRHTPSRTGLTIASKAGPVWNGQVRFNDQWLTQPLHWKKPRKIFVCAHGDLFHENVPDEWIDKVFAVMALAPQHQFQVLTKRAERMRAYCSGLKERAVEIAQRAVWLGIWDDPDIAASDTVAAIDAGPLPNVWLGVSVEDQLRANERIPHLLATPAAIRFISAEPLLGAIDLAAFLSATPAGSESVRESAHQASGRWVIAGGESGPNARPMHPDWARSLRDQCAAAGVPFFFQWGEWGMPTAPLGELDWPYHRDYDRTHWFDQRLCVRDAPEGWADKYIGGGGAWPPPPFDMFQTPEFLAQVQNCKQISCRESGRCMGNESRAAVTWLGKKKAGNFLDGRQHLDFPR